ncbi:MAG: hypothetical protein H0V79_06890, partial [Actinobacteria bacterium]|nr:hypothetical protein [Actinomycetota bacterium]
RRAARLHARGSRAAAQAIFARQDELQARAAAAISAWPAGSLEQLEELGQAHPRSGAVQFHLGLARFWKGDTTGAFEAWRAARTRDPDTAFAVKASDLLFRGFPAGLPTFVPSFRAPRSVQSLPAPRQLRELERRARRPDAHAKLLYGLALQRLERPVSARRQYAAAARLAPEDPEARVADAIGRFDKQRPERSFSRLGPLTRRFPRAATVRFHLGLLLLWLGNVEEARRQLERARALPSPLSGEAKRLLTRLEEVRAR